MKELDLKIVGTEEFITETKEKIKTNLKKGMNEEEAVISALPDTFPKEVKESISKIVKIYIKNKEIN